MQPTREQLVFLDTNAIIELFRVHGWNALAGVLKLATVEMCCTEASRGDSARHGYVPVDVALIRKNATVVSVTSRQLANLMLRLPDSAALDYGERELLAHLITRTDAWLICSPDRGCIRAGKKLNLLDRFITLEELMDATGHRAELATGYTKQWMSNFRTGLLLEDGL